MLMFLEHADVADVCLSIVPTGLVKQPPAVFLLIKGLFCLGPPSVCRVDWIAGSLLCELGWSAVFTDAH